VIWGYGTTFDVVVAIMNDDFAFSTRQFWYNISAFMIKSLYGVI
jgi:hypothetical protein